MDLTFDDLLQDSEKLLMDIQGDTDLPRITRSLDQMKTFGEKLYLARGSRSDVKAARLLGSKMSYELPAHLSSKLESLSAAGVVESAPSAPDLDIQSFLRTERENALLNVIALTQKSVFEEVESRSDRCLQSWWEQEAVGVLSALVGAAGPLDTDILHYQSTGDLTSSVDFGGDIGRNSNRTREELCYAKHLDRYLSIQFAGKGEFGYQPSSDVVPNLLTFLAEANCPPSDTRTSSSRISRSHSDIIELWSFFGRVGERLQGMYEDIRSSPISRALELRASTSLQSVLIECSLSHLESEFMEFLRVTVASQPRLARLGGRPGTRALVRAYLTIRLPSSSADLSLKNSSLDNSAMNPQDQNDIEYEDGLIDSKPVWPMIYCCMRAGDYRAAVEVARAASNNLDNFASILEDFANSGRRLSATTQSRFRQNCRQVLKTSRDPYKRLIYSILGLCGLNESYSEVARTIDDFLWLKLSHIAAAHQSATSATTSGTASSGIAFEELPTLGQLQTLLYETYGEVHFDAWSQPLVYFKILCLTQQFEGAIGFLARFETLRSHAVHIALALHDSSLLLLPSSLQCALVSRSESDPIGFRRLNLARLVMLFTRKFEVTNPIEALMYFYFLSDIQSESAVNLNDSQRPFDRSTDENLNGATNTKEKTSSLFVKCVCELALATKEFDLLLGCVTESGVRKPGAVDRYCKTSEERQSLVASVAGAVESRGQLVEAIVLYRLAACSGNSKHYLRKSVSLANYLLAGLVAVDNANTTSQAFPRMAGQPDRDLVLRVATELAREVRQSGSSVLGSALSVSMTSEDDDAQSDEGTVISSTKTLFYLLDLATFFDLYQAERWQAAIDHMDQLGLFPTNPQPEHVESRVALFTKLPDFVRRPIPSALLALMRCLAARVSKGRFTAASGDRMESGSSLTVAEARTRAKALIAYVGRIPYRLPGEIYARLTQMDMELM